MVHSRIWFLKPHWYWTQKTGETLGYQFNLRFYVPAQTSDLNVNDVIFSIFRSKEKEEVLNSKRHMHRSLKFFSRRPFGRSDSYSEDEDGRGPNKSVHFKVKLRMITELSDCSSSQNVCLQFRNIKQFIISPDRSKIVQHLLSNKC